MRDHLISVKTEREGSRGGEETSKDLKGPLLLPHGSLSESVTGYEDRGRDWNGTSSRGT